MGQLYVTLLFFPSYSTNVSSVQSYSGICHSGVPGLDKVLGGGIPRARTIVVRGGIGTGKTVLSAQFIHNGAVQYGEPGVLMVLEEKPDQYKKDMLRFGLDLGKLEGVGIVAILDRPFCASYLEKKTATVRPDERNFFGMSEMVDLMIESARRIKARRVVLDNLPALSCMLKYGECVRQVLLYMNDRLQKEGLTTILVSDVAKKRPDAVADYLCDGVVYLSYTTDGPDAGRSLYVQKMKGAGHSQNEHPIAFKEGVGICVEA